MLSEDKVIEISVMAEEFCKVLMRCSDVVVLTRLKMNGN